MYKRILITLDNSSTDQTILNHIRSLAHLTKADLILVHVADGFVARLQDQLNLEDSEEIKKDKLYLEEQSQKLSVEGFIVKSILVNGKEPVDGILDIAQGEGCDLIAMATHGHGFVKDLVLGSVAENLRHRTDIPILMIRSSVK
ncbi:MAG: universal stress protein [Candidatus Omnitrophota bacterium]